MCKLKLQLFTQTVKYTLKFISSKHVRGYSFVCDCQREKEMCFI